MISCGNMLSGNSCSQNPPWDVVVQIMDIRAHEQLQYGGDDTVDEDLGCDQACPLRGGGPVI